MCWHRMRIELNEIVTTLPEVPPATEQVVRLEWLASINAEFIELQIDPAGLRVVRIGVHDRHDDVGLVLGDLAVGNELLVINRMKPQAAIGV
jgi:hypothetical protein